MAERPSYRKYDEQEVANQTLDDSLGLRKVQPYGWTGTQAVALAVDSTGRLRVDSTTLVTSVTGTTNRISVSPTTGNVIIDIDAAYVGQTSITTLGTITTGVWSGTTIAVSKGGTGVTALSNVLGTSNQVTVNNGLARVIGGNVTISLPVSLALGTGDVPIITRGWDPFTSGVKNGFGRWGLYMEPGTLTFGTTGGAAFQWVGWNADSTINATPMTLSGAGNLGVLGAVTANGATINGVTLIGGTGSSAVPASGNACVVQWNGTGGSAEIDFINTFSYGTTPGGGYNFYQRWDNSGNTLSWLTPGKSSDFTLMGNIGPYGWASFPYSNTSQNIVGMNVAGTHVTTGLGTGGWRDYGLQFVLTISGDGSTNDATSGASGFEGAVFWGSTGTLTKGIGGRASINNTSTGTITTGYTFDFYPMGNTGGGTITNGIHAPFGLLPPITTTGQTRANIQFNTAMPAQASSALIAAQWFNYSSTAPADGIWWGTTLHTGLYSGASTQLNLTGAFVGSARITGTTLTASGDAGGVASTTSLSNVTDPTKTAAVTLVERNGNPGNTHQGWIKLYVGTTAFYVPYFN